MLHGSIENGKIFYSSSGKGLAPFLASNGFDVFVPDLRGRGLSTPSIHRSSGYGVYESIVEEIPIFIDKIRELKGSQSMQWVAHSWGGVLVLCYYARFQSHASFVASMVFFGTKRRIVTHSIKRYLMVEGVYGLLFSIIGFIKGFVDAKMISVGSDNETLKANRETWRWITKNSWKDEDGFDYKRVLPGITLPPVLYITGANDDVLGNPKDVELLMNETGTHQRHEFYLASKKNGNLHNYDHINLLTHHDAVNDHFQMVIEWMQKHDRKTVEILR